jgi:hypothetical protein
MENQPIYIESDEQISIGQDLYRVLLDTRGEPGIPLEEVARIIRAVFDRAEVECIIRTLETNGKNGKTPTRPR